MALLRCASYTSVVHKKVGGYHISCSDLTAQGDVSRRHACHHIHQAKNLPPILINVLLLFSPAPAGILMSHRLFDPTALGDVNGNAAAKQYPWGKGLDARHVRATEVTGVQSNGFWILRSFRPLLPTGQMGVRDNPRLRLSPSPSSFNTSYSIQSKGEHRFLLFQKRTTENTRYRKKHRF